MIAPSNSGKSQRGLLYSLAVALIFAFAIWRRLTLPLEPIADPDTWGYLLPALRKLAGAEFSHTLGRNFIYPGLLLLLLRAFGDFRAITIAQHFLGLAAGGVLLLSWRQARVLLPTPRLGRATHDALGLIAAAIFLFASEPIHFEMRIRPEGVCAFLLSINMWLVIRFLICCFIEDRPTAANIYGIALVCSSILLASVKPSFVIAAIVAALPVAAFFFRRDRLWQKLVIAGGSVVSAALLLLPEHFLSRNDEKSRTFLPTTLFVMHANLIRDQMSDDLQRGVRMPYPREWLERVHAALSAEITKSATAGRQYHVSADFSPDYLMYDPTSIAARLRTEFGGNVAGLCAFYRFYYCRIWQYRPLQLIRKIARQMSIFYAPICPVYNQAKIMSLADEYQRSVKSLDISAYRKIWRSYPPEVDILDRTGMIGPTAPVIEQPAYIQQAIAIVAATYLPLLFFGVGLSGFILVREGYRQRLGWLAVIVLLFFMYNFASCLEVAVVNLLEYRRHIAVQFYSTLLAQFFALWFALETALDLRRPAKDSLPSKL